MLSRPVTCAVLSELLTSVALGFITTCTLYASLTSSAHHFSYAWPPQCFTSRFVFKVMNFYFRSFVIGIFSRQFLSRCFPSFELHRVFSRAITVGVHREYIGAYSSTVIVESSANGRHFTPRYCDFSFRAPHWFDEGFRLLVPSAREFLTRFRRYWFDLISGILKRVAASISRIFQH